MRAIPIITLTLSPLGLLVAQGFSSGEQSQSAESAEPSLPLAESDPKLDAIDQVIAEEPPAPSPVETASIPEFSLNLLAQLPPRSTPSPEPSPSTLTSRPEIPSDVIQRIVNRSVFRTAESIASARSSPNPLVTPSQQATQRTEAENPTQFLPRPSELPVLNLAAADVADVVEGAEGVEEAEVVEVAALDTNVSQAAMQNATTAPIGLAPFINAYQSLSSMDEWEIGEWELANVVALSPSAEPSAEPTVADANQINTDVENLVVTEIAFAQTAQNPEVQNPEIADQSDSFLQPVNAIAPEAAPRPEFAIAQAPPPAPVVPAGFENIGETYVLGPGDSIQINLFNVPEYSGQQQILVDGTVNLPLVGRLPLAGLTISQAEETISARYASELEYSIATVSLLQPRALRVALAGEIAQPGLYTLPSSEGGQFPTVVQAIQTAGGTTQAADLRQVQVHRRDPSGATRTFNVNLQALLQTGDVTQNTSLRDGDTVFIPATAEINLADSSQLAASNLRTNTNQPVSIAIVGEVAQPGPYRLEGGQPTLIQTIQQAGGFTPTADLRQIEVRRQTRQGTEQVLTVNLWDVLQSGDLAQDVILQQGDRITIPAATELASEEAFALASSSLSTGEIQVNIIGEVRSPGQLGLRANSTLNQAVLAAGGFNGRANRKDVTLIRFNPNGTITEQELEIDFSEGLNPENNPLLRNNDVILVGRSTGARITDTLSTILGVFQLISPFRSLSPF